MMDEAQYQLGIRKLSPFEKTTMIIVYRNELMAFREFLQLYLAQLDDSELIQKASVQTELDNLSAIISDYKKALEQGGITNVE